LRKKQRHRHLAAAFAAKEACMKAMGTGWGGGTQWKDIELVDEDGKESIRLYNKAGELCAGKKIFVSTNGERDFAVAMVVISDDA
jgi:holo-[acyl-carrier protein] synthase